MPADTATREGVVSGRSDVYAEILKNREVQIDAELKEGGTTEGIAALAREAQDDPLKPADIPQEDWDAMSDEQKNNTIADAKKAEEAAKQSEVVETEEEKAAREAKEAEAKAAEAKKTEKLKIDGEEREVEVEKIMDAGRRAMQKELAADKRLEEATRVKEEAERLRKEAEAALSSGTQARQSKPAAEAVAIVEKLKPVVHKMQYGTADEAAAALAEIIESTKSEGLSDQQITLLVNQELSLRESRAFVKANYPEVLADERLKKIFVDDVNGRIAAGDTRPYQEICKDVGDELRAWKGAPASKEATPPAKPQGASRAAVHERKTTIVQVPSAAARQPAPTQQAAPSASDIVAQQRAHRDRQAGRGG
jgi:hypothetical protein